MVLTPTRVDIPAALAQARSTGEKVVLPAGWVQPTEGLYDGATVIARRRLPHRDVAQPDQSNRGALCCPVRGQ